MAGANYHPVRSRSAEIIDVVGYFVGKGTDPPTTIVGRGVSSISRSDVGALTLNLEESFYRLLSCSFCIQTVDATAANGKTVNVISDSMTNKTVVIQIRNCADPNANSDIATTEKCYFILKLQRTSQL